MVTLRAGVIVALLAVAGCGSSSGGPGQEVNRYPGGVVMPIGGPPLSDGGSTPIPPPVLACRRERASADASADGAPDSSGDFADGGGVANEGGADVVAGDSPDAGAYDDAGVDPCLPYM